MDIRSQDIMLAAKELQAQAKGKGPVLGFTFLGELASTTYDFIESESQEQKVSDTCIEEFAKCLNDVLHSRRKS